MQENVVWTYLSSPEIAENWSVLVPPVRFSIPEKLDPLTFPDLLPVRPPSTRLLSRPPAAGVRAPCWRRLGPQKLAARPCRAWTQHRPTRSISGTASDPFPIAASPTSALPRGIPVN